MEWFTASKAGLAKILRERGYPVLINELISNALDTETGIVKVVISWARGVCTVEVEDDDPNGFANLSHAWTLFAESEKKGDPLKRGRFNLGEKLVLAACRKAQIDTTTGRVVFDKKGRRKTSTKREIGSRFYGEILMTKTKADEMIEAAESIIPPSHRMLVVNGVQVEPPVLKQEIEVRALPTVACDAEGQLKRTSRNTTVAVYEIAQDEEPWIHEMGIPVCPLEEGDPWHLDVHQKVPVSLDRTSVPGKFLRTLRLAVLNALVDELDEEDANAGWVRETAKEEEIDDEVTEKILDLRFSKKRVAYDPNDEESNKLAVSKGYRLVYGSQMSKPEWSNARRAGAISPAGRVTPSNAALVSDPNGVPDDYPEDKVTPEMRAVRVMLNKLGHQLLELTGRGGRFLVQFAKRPRESALGWYGDRTLSLNVSRLGKKWFSRVVENERGHAVRCYDLLIHELGHEFSGDHLSEDYHQALTRLGAALARLALDEPAVFKVAVEVEA